MSCPFYGKHALQSGLVDQAGNQCALIVDSYAPCIMEVWEQTTPDFNTCVLLKLASSARAKIAEEMNAAVAALKPRKPS